MALRAAPHYLVKGYSTRMAITMPLPMPEGVEDGILKGMYQYQTSRKKDKNKVHLLGSGAIMVEVLKAAKILEDDYGVAADVWSVTSYKSLYDDAIPAVVFTDPEIAWCGLTETEAEAQGTDIKVAKFP